MNSNERSPLDSSKLNYDLAKVLNEHSIDNHLETPDFILSKYIIRSLHNFRETNRSKNSWSNL